MWYNSVINVVYLQALDDEKKTFRKPPSLECLPNPSTNSKQKPWIYSNILRIVCVYQTYSLEIGVNLVLVYFGL